MQISIFHHPADAHDVQFSSYTTSSTILSIDLEIPIVSGVNSTTVVSLGIVIVL